MPGWIGLVAIHTRRPALYQVPSTGRYVGTPSPPEPSLTLLLRLKARENAKERPESRISQSAEAPRELPLPSQPHAVPNKARSPTSEEVSKIMRRMRTEMREFAEETLQKSKEKSASRLFHEKEAPPSAPLPRQSKRGVYTPRTPSGTPRSGNMNWGESLLAQPNFLLDNQESRIIN